MFWSACHIRSNAERAEATHYREPILSWLVVYTQEPPRRRERLASGQCADAPRGEPVTWAERARLAQLHTPTGQQAPNNSTRFRLRSQTRVSLRFPSLRRPVGRGLFLLAHLNPPRRLPHFLHIPRLSTPRLALASLPRVACVDHGRGAPGLRRDFWSRRHPPWHRYARGSIHPDSSPSRSVPPAPLRTEYGPIR